ncbi:unnamed protein product [Sphenostylis stenocarpa]|uniref:R13L1/DRL21-like LRR repeat region domain-containing protein n=1 Tax=Sphenostylis stenocarpa TaxID=92480 RepID=A0AA86W3T6_9FABA|nr:unnamed protein product [Sphenostylis stenocarpa]
MSSFIVGRSREFRIQQLRELNLRGRLSITDLQNIENPLDASEADLKNKTLELHLQWDWWNRNAIDSTKEGEDFLPFLKYLNICHLDGIVSIDADFHGNNSSSFKSLETLEFRFMQEWEKWECQTVTGAFPHLQRLYIKSCPKLKGHLPEPLVPLKKVEISDCQQLEASAPGALDLRLHSSGKIQFDWATLKELWFGGHNMEAWLMEMVGHIVSDTSLEKLEIYSCSDCPICNDFGSLSIFLLDFFPKLKRLNLSDFHNLKMISLGLGGLRFLEFFYIGRCPQFESLPENMHMLLPSLTELYISNCPRLESFPGGGLPSNLKVVTLNNCTRLIGSLKGALGDNSSLESLYIENVNAECFPEEGLLPLSLTTLCIADCPNLKELDYKGLCQISSLKKLLIGNCPNLQNFPEEGLPKSISHLTIEGNCPLLKQRFQVSECQDWGKVAHIESFIIH